MDAATDIGDDGTRAVKGIDSMKQLLLLTGLIAAMATALPAPDTSAATRNFFNPTVGGDLLSFCSNFGGTCGKPIADAWCRAIGFEEALNYQRAHANGRVIIARYADSGAVCRGTDCQSFKQIKCWNPAS